MSLFPDCPPAGASQGVNEALAAVAAPLASGQRVGIPFELISVPGRKAQHASSRERVKAHRAARARLDYTDKPEIAETIRDIAAQLDCSANEVMQSLVRFALTNRNWKQVGLYGSRGRS